MSSSNSQHRDLSENDSDPDDLEQVAAVLVPAASSLRSARSGSDNDGHGPNLCLMVNTTTTDQTNPSPRNNQHLRHSIWECETTPMTTRPHFESNNNNNVSPNRPITTNTIRRVRSRSLGSAMEQQRVHQQQLESGHLLLPLMDWDVYDLRAAVPRQKNLRANSDRQIESQSQLLRPSLTLADETTPMLAVHQPSAQCQPQSLLSSSAVASHVALQTTANIRREAEHGEHHHAATNGAAAAVAVATSAAGTTSCTA